MWGSIFGLGRTLGIGIGIRIRMWVNVGIYASYVVSMVLIIGWKLELRYSIYSERYTVS